MMKSLKKKLKSKAGESLTETLVAILIFTLSSVIFFNMVQTSNRINGTARDKEQKVQEQMVAAEKAEGTPEDGKAYIRFRKADGSNITEKEIGIDIYGDTADGLFSYFRK